MSIGTATVQLKHTDPNFNSTVACTMANLGSCGAVGTFGCSWAGAGALWTARNHLHLSIPSPAITRESIPRPFQPHCRPAPFTPGRTSRCGLTTWRRSRCPQAQLVQPHHPLARCGGCRRRCWRRSRRRFSCACSSCACRSCRFTGCTRPCLFFVVAAALLGLAAILQPVRHCPQA